jgi:hypothetical protein
MANNSFEQPQQWSQELQGSFVDTSTMFRNGPDYNNAGNEAHETHQKKGHSEKVTEYRLEQPEEEDEGYKIRTEKFNERKSKTLSDSYLFTWGDGKGGQLAQQNEEDILIPYVVNNPFKDMPIKACALGKRHSLFLTEKGCMPSNALCKISKGDATARRPRLLLRQRPVRPAWQQHARGGPEPRGPDQKPQGHTNDRGRGPPLRRRVAGHRPAPPQGTGEPAAWASRGTKVHFTSEEKARSGEYSMNPTAARRSRRAADDRPRRSRARMRTHRGTAPPDRRGCRHGGPRMLTCGSGRAGRAC